jgi:hypothetical protein
MGRMLELSEAVYEALIEAARASGVAPSEWIAARLPGRGNHAPSTEPLAVVREWLFRHVVSLGHPIGTDNEAIEADLARGYGDPLETDDDAPTSAY